MMTAHTQETAHVGVRSSSLVCVPPLEPAITFRLYTPTLSPSLLCALPLKRQRAELWQEKMETQGSEGFKVVVELYGARVRGLILVLREEKIVFCRLREGDSRKQSRRVTPKAEDEGDAAPIISRAEFVLNRIIKQIPPSCFLTFFSPFD